MTTCALPAELPEVNVVSVMTGGTGFRWPRLVILTFLVAVKAGEVRMSPFQGKAGTFRVIEFPQKPVVWVVAGSAVRSKAAFVWIFLTVAITA